MQYLIQKKKTFVARPVSSLEGRSLSIIQEARGYYGLRENGSQRPITNQPTNLDSANLDSALRKKNLSEALSLSPIFMIFLMIITR